MKRIKTAKSLLACTLIGLAILSAAGCAKGPIPNSTLYAYGDEKDPSNKTIASFGASIN